MATVDDKLMQRQAEVQDIIDATDVWNIDSKLERAMGALRCPPGDWPVTNLSGGERRRVALCRLLLQKPDVLLLDEPTNHLDAESIDWLEQHLQQYEGTVIAVTHDRYFLDDVSEWILELDRGEGIPWKGNYSSWLDQKTKRMEQEEKSASKRRKTVKLAYVDQQHKDIDPQKTVYEVISQGNETIRMGGRDVNARAYISRFNFSDTDQSKLCSVLSGGERNRLQLALALKQEGNVLLLDEPTNDIDVNTLRALEEGLEAFAGCAVVISHDRWFLDRICTHILAFEGNGEVFFFEGSYSEYEINKARRLGDTEIKKGRYRKLMEE